MEAEEHEIESFQEKMAQVVSIARGLAFACDLPLARESLSSPKVWKLVDIEPAIHTVDRYYILISFQ